jgi:formylmethanofuran dehydrogenase subunit E
VFDLTEVRFETPPDAFKRYKTRKCPRCGEDCREPFLRVVDGEIVCSDCAETGR